MGGGDSSHAKTEVGVLPTDTYLLVNRFGPAGGQGGHRSTGGLRGLREHCLAGAMPRRGPDGRIKILESTLR